MLAGYTMLKVNIEASAIMLNLQGEHLEEHIGEETRRNFSRVDRRVWRVPKLKECIEGGRMMI